jgi:hypothetical protein
VMDEVPAPRDIWRAYRVGPDAAGATSDGSPQGDPGGARRRPRLRLTAEDLAIFGRLFAQGGAPACRSSGDSLARD